MQNGTYMTSVISKWGDVARPGFLPLPYALLANQAKLGLTSEELNVLLNVLVHWHDKFRMPYPHSKTIALRMNVSQRTVQRIMSGLIQRGFLAKAQKHLKTDPQSYDVTPLINMLEPYAHGMIQLRGENTFDQIRKGEDDDEYDPQPYETNEATPIEWDDLICPDTSVV